MKQKIKIMKHKQQLSDEEIQSYMNFDRLLDSRKVALSSTRPMSILKWSIPIFTVAMLTGWYVLVKDNAPAKKQVAASPQIQQAPAITSDSSKDERRPAIDARRGRNKKRP